MSNADGWKGARIKDSYNEFIRTIEAAGFQYLSSGSFRMGYQREDKIIKVPRYSDGLIDNMVEARAWRKYRNRPTSEGLHLAPCRLLPNGCLMMVCVRRTGLYDRPAWCDKIDGAQVGIYLGRYVAFDYALEIPERFEWEKEWNKRSVFFNSPCWERYCGSVEVLERLRQMRQEELVA